MNIQAQPSITQHDCKAVTNPTAKAPKNNINRSKKPSTSLLKRQLPLMQRSQHIQLKVINVLSTSYQHPQEFGGFWDMIHQSYKHLLYIVLDRLPFL